MLIWEGRLLMAHEGVHAVLCCLCHHSLTSQSVQQILGLFSTVSHALSRTLVCPAPLWAHSGSVAHWATLGFFILCSSMLCCFLTVSWTGLGFCGDFFFIPFSSSLQSSGLTKQRSGHSGSQNKRKYAPFPWGNYDVLSSGFSVSLFKAVIIPFLFSICWPGADP